MSDPRKRIVIDPNFLKLPMKGGRTRKNKENNPKPIKIRSESHSEKTIKRRALNYIRKQQEERYKRLMKGIDNEPAVSHEPDTKNYADDFKSEFDKSLEFFKNLTDQNTEQMQIKNATLRQYPPIVPNTTLLQSPVFDKIVHGNQGIVVEEPQRLPTTLSPIQFPKPTYGCLKGGKLQTYRTLKANGFNPHPTTTETPTPLVQKNTSLPVTNKLTPEQQKAELKQFLEKRRDEKQRVERVKRQHNLARPVKKQKRTTTRTFRVGKSKHYPRIGVLIPNKTIRTQILAKKQTIRETSMEDIRKYLIKKGLIRVGSSSPNDVLRQMYESSMMICGELQNHNSENLLYNYLHNSI